MQCQYIHVSNFVCYYYLKTVPPETDEDTSLPTAAIVFIAVAAYMVVFIIAVLIRRCLQVRNWCFCMQRFIHYIQCEEKIS